MFLVQLLLPLTYGDGSGPVDPTMVARVRAILIERFAGMTAYTRSPAVGFWADQNREVIQDEIAVVEVMADHVDIDWWEGFRLDLEASLLQKEIVIRVHPITRL